MPFNGSGSFSPPGADFPAVANTLIEASKFNNVINDIATGLSTCITVDGQSTVTNDIPFGGFRLKSIGAPADTGDALREGSPIGSVSTSTGAFSKIVTERGDTASIVSGVATSIKVIGNGTAGTYIFSAGIFGSGNSIYTASATVTDDGGGNARIVANNGANLTITLAGAAVQVTQTSGSNQIVHWAYIFIG